MHGTRGDRLRRYDAIHVQMASAYTSSQYVPQGGGASEGGSPITDAMITSGTIAVPKGRPAVPKAVQIAP